MSAEVLRQLTVDHINRAIGDQVQYLTDTHDQSIDAVRITQGMISGLKLAVQLQDEAYKRMNA